MKSIMLLQKQNMVKISNKTLLFTLEYPPQIGGVANYYGNLVKYWQDDIFVLTNKVIKPTIDGLTAKRVNLLKPHWIFSLWYLWREIRKYKINTVLVGHILPLGTVTWLLHKIIKFNYVVFLHGMDFSFAMKSRRKRWLAQRILENSKKIICVNGYVAKLIKDNFDKDIFAKAAVVNPGINKQVTSNKSQVTSNKSQVTSLKEKYNLKDKKILLQVGRLVKRKGHDKVIEALPETLKECPNLVYVIIGNGSELSNYKLQITSAKLEKSVILIIDANDEELATWYELCDIFIMPSRNMNGDFEGFGIVYLEANLHGKPVIAGDSGGVRDAVEDNVNGLLVNPEYVDEIAQAIIRLYKDESLAKKLGEQGKDRAIREFDWEKKVASIKKRITHVVLK